MSIIVANNTLKGTFRPPRFRVYGLEWGVPFMRVYRSRKAALKLQQKDGITSFTLQVLQ